MPSYYDLKEVKRLVEEALDNPKKSKVIFTAKSKSVDSVIKTLSGRGQKLNSNQAGQYICHRLLQLEEANFYQTEGGQWGDPTCFTDQYGLRHDGIPWFIKFLINSDTKELEEISFHPTDRDMKLANGTVIKMEGSAR